MNAFPSKGRIKYIHFSRDNRIQIDLVYTDTVESNHPFSNSLSSYSRDTAILNSGFSRKRSLCSGETQMKNRSPTNPSRVGFSFISYYRSPIQQNQYLVVLAQQTMNIYFQRPYQHWDTAHTTFKRTVRSKFSFVHPTISMCD